MTELVKLLLMALPAILIGLLVLGGWREALVGLVVLAVLVVGVSAIIELMK